MPRKDLVSRTDYRKEQWAFRKAAGRCVACNGPLPTAFPPSKSGIRKRSKLRCVPCAARACTAAVKSSQRRRQRFRRAGLCQDCGERKPRAHRIYCRSCVKRREARYAIHRERYIADHKVAHQALKLRVFEAYGGAACACCGESRLEFLSIDHIDNKGNEHRRAVFGDNRGGNIYGWLKARKFPKGFRVLCMNCNFAIGHYTKVCPHETERLADASRALAAAGAVDRP
jgi:hypothetical protein